jgi:hypothetical protein
MEDYLALARAEISELPLFLKSVQAARLLHPVAPESASPPPATTSPRSCNAVQLKVILEGAGRVPGMP